jgi:hypothetical protein
MDGLHYTQGDTMNDTTQAGHAMNKAYDITMGYNVPLGLIQRIADALAAAQERIKLLEANDDPEALAISYDKGYSDARDRFKARIAGLEAQLAAHPDEWTPDFALCQLVDAAPVPLDMPDSAGWWAFDGVDTEDDNYAYQCPFELRLSSGELRLAVGVDGMEEPIERFVGKWYRLQMPWQAQPSEEGDE